MIPIKIKEYIQGKIILSSTPKILNIEVTNFCNLNCPICVAKNTRKQGFLDLNLLEKIIKENKTILKNQFIWLHFNGEPLLHNDFPKIIQILKENGINTRLSTNATLLTEEISSKLMEAGLDYIVFSVDGYTKDTYEKIRKGANFEQVERNILNFLKIKRKKRFKTKIQIQIIKTKENAKEIKPFIQKWKKTDVNYINVKSFCSRAWRAREINRFAEVLGLKKRIENRFPCFYLWETLIILWDGKVIPCCQDLSGELEVGDVKNENLLQIWNNSRMVDLRKRQLKGDFSMIPCNRCPDWKGFPRNYFYYFSNSFFKFVLKKIFNRERKDEGINIIFNRK